MKQAAVKEQDQTRATRRILREQGARSPVMHRLVVRASEGKRHAYHCVAATAETVVSCNVFTSSVLAQSYGKAVRKCATQLQYKNLFLV